jgi:hypothetical protein
MEDGAVADQHPFPAHAGADGVGGQPGAGLVAADDLGPTQPPLLDRRSAPAQRPLGPAQRVGDGALADRQAEQVRHEARQALVADGVVVVQVGQHRHDRRAERGTGRHARRRGATDPPSAARAASAEDPHPGHRRPDRRQVDMVVGVANRLPLLGHRHPAVCAALGVAVHDVVRFGREGPRHARIVTPAAGASSPAAAWWPSARATAAGWSWRGSWAARLRRAGPPAPRSARPAPRAACASTTRDRSTISSSFWRGVRRDGSNGGMPRLTHIRTSDASPSALGLRLRPHRSPANSVSSYP